MRLALNDKEILEPLSEAVVTHYLHSFINGGDDAFIVLSKNDASFIQVCRSETGSFWLESQEGSLAKHYSCRNQSLTEEQLISAFLSFYLDDQSFKSDLIWQRESLSDDFTSNETGELKLWHMIIVVLIVLVFLSWSLVKTYA